MAYILPAKIPNHLRRLHHYHSTDSGDSQLRLILESARLYVIEEIDFDNYDGGSAGHGIALFLPVEVLGPVSPKLQKKLTDDLLKAIREIAGITPGEYISYVHFELDDVNDDMFKASKSVLAASRAIVGTSGIWQPDMVRVFISHRDNCKSSARELADALEAFGFTCFVAHDTITPMTQWRLEIEKGLVSMDVMLVYLTDDFHDSNWTNQEVGFALGSDKPLVMLKLGKKDPEGFIGHIQALKGDIDNPSGFASNLAKILADATRSKDRVQTAIVSTFANSPDWSETTRRFNQMKAVVQKLSEKELQIIVDAFRVNDQLFNAEFLINKKNRLVGFLNETTGKEFSINGIRVVEVVPDDEIPF